MMEWLKVHTFLAAWLGPAVGIIGLVLQQTRRKARFDFRSFTIYLTFFVFTGFALSPDFDSSKHLIFGVIWFMCFIYILNGDILNKVKVKKSIIPVNNSASKLEISIKPPSSQDVSKEP